MSKGTVPTIATIGGTDWQARMVATTQLCIAEGTIRAAIAGEWNASTMTHLIAIVAADENTSVVTTSVVGWITTHIPTNQITLTGTPIGGCIRTATHSNQNGNQ